VAKTQECRSPLPRAVAFAVAVAAVPALCGCTRPPATVVLSGATMGTVYTVKVVVKSSSRKSAAVDTASLVQQCLDDVNAKMSTYQEDSELSRFNRFEEASPFPVSSETAEVFEVAREVSDATGGAFDVTVGPLVDAWGFGPPGRAESPPSDEELEALRARVGYQMLEIDPAAGTLRKLRPDVHCDLSAVAKGYAVDCVAERIEQQGFTDYMVEVGGEVRTGGLNAEGIPWRIAIEKPTPNVRSIESVVSLSGEAMATSGDYRNFVDVAGQRYSHTMDPRTGRPVRHKLASVSVIHKRCAVADAFATGLMVLGPEEGPALAERENLAALFLVHVGEGGFTRVATSAFEALTKDGAGRAARTVPIEANQ